MSISSILNWIATFLVGLVFSALAAFCLLRCIRIYRTKILPETTRDRFIQSLVSGLFSAGFMVFLLFSFGTVLWAKSRVFGSILIPIVALFILIPVVLLVVLGSTYLHFLSKTAERNYRQAVKVNKVEQKTK